MERVADELIASLSKTFKNRTPKKRTPKRKRARSLAERLAILWPKFDLGPKLTRFERAENYLAALCEHLEVKKPLLLFSEEMQNEGACGEAGRVTIRLHTPFVLNRDWIDVLRTVRHELAHIVVSNTPGMGEVPAHGAEFESALIRVGKAANKLY